MTTENFFDMFNRIHNPDYYYGKQKTQKKKAEKKKKTRIPTQSNDIPFSKYRIEWVDALSDSGWADDKEFNKMKLAYPVNEGWLYSKDKTSVKVFASYDLDPTTKEMTYGDRTMIPTTWIVKMTKIQ